GSDYLYLLLCEGPDFCLSNQDYSDDGAFPEHRDSEDRSGTAQPISGPLIFRIRENVGDVNHPVLKCDSRNSASSPWANRISLNEIFPLLRHIISDGGPQQLAVHPQNEPRIGTAQSCSVLNQCFQNGLKIKSRAADDLQHFARGGLLVQCFGEIAISNLQLLE